MGDSAAPSPGAGVAYVGLRPPAPEGPPPRHGAHNHDAPGVCAGGLMLPPSGPHSVSTTARLDLPVMDSSREAVVPPSAHRRSFASNGPASVDLHSLVPPALQEAVFRARKTDDEIDAVKKCSVREFYERQNATIEFILHAHEDLALALEADAYANGAGSPLAASPGAAGASVAIGLATDASEASAVAAAADAPAVVPTATVSVELVLAAPAPAASSSAASSSVWSTAPRIDSAAAAQDAGTRRRASSAAAGPRSRSSSVAAASAAAATDRHDRKATELRARASAIRFIINASFVANLVIFALKLFIIGWAFSLAVVASTLDSCLDLASGLVIWMSARMAARESPYRFPVGKTRYEPLAVIVFSGLMVVTSVLIIAEAVNAVTEALAQGPPVSKVDGVTYGVLVFCTVLKLALLLMCAKLRQFSSSVESLALDHLADVVTNTGTLVAVLVTHYVASLWWFDPAGAVGLALWMLYMWTGNAREQILLLAGQSATPAELSQITFLAMTHPRVQVVDTVLAYQVGNKLQVEIDIVLPAAMPLATAHDVGEGLQRKVERLDNVERCFVHLDTEFDHRRAIEHVNPILKI